MDYGLETVPVTYGRKKKNQWKLTKEDIQVLENIEIAHPTLVPAELFQKLLLLAYKQAQIDKELKK